MAFKFPETEFDKNMRKKVQPRVKDLAAQITARGELISIRRWEEILETFDGLNSYERHLLQPLFDNDQLLKDAKYCLGNCYYERSMPPRSYNEAFYLIYGPLLMERLEQLMQIKVGLEKDITQLKAQIDILDAPPEE